VAPATNLLRVPSLKGTSKEKRGLPSKKPVELVTKLVACASDPGDLVLDPFAGSGTTSVVAQTLGRAWLGIEINPDYVDLAQKRLSESADLFNSSGTAKSAAADTE
jgi:site-specific DNA-methyltransferase (adenine-specific)